MHGRTCRAGAGEGAVNHATRALVLLLLGAALRDCLLLGAGLLVWSEHRARRLDACPDRAHAWMRCVLDGAALLAAGSVLALHTASVALGWWPRTLDINPLVSATLALAVAIGGLSADDLTRRHGAIGLGVLTVALSQTPAMACAFAALVSAAALFDGTRHLGSGSRALAAPHDER
jgi:hypothetical protein